MFLQAILPSTRRKGKKTNTLKKNITPPLCVIVHGAQYHAFSVLGSHSKFLESSLKFIYSSLVQSFVSLPHVGLWFAPSHFVPSVCLFYKITCMHEGFFSLCTRYSCNPIITPQVARMRCRNPSEGDQRRKLAWKTVKVSPPKIW